MKQLNVRVSDELAKQFKMKVLKCNGTSQGALEYLVQRWAEGEITGTVHLSKTHSTKLKLIAEQKGRTVSYLVAEALDLYIRANEK